MFINNLSLFCRFGCVFVVVSIILIIALFVRVEIVTPSV